MVTTSTSKFLVSQGAHNLGLRFVAMRQRDLALSFLALAASAFVTLSAQATHLAAPAKTYSPIEKIGCKGPGTFCPRGLHWVCNPSRCGCAPCSGGPRPYGGRARMPPSGGTGVAPRATAMHYVVLDEVGHCIVVDSKPSAGSNLKIVGGSGWLHLIGSRE